MRPGPLRLVIAIVLILPGVVILATVLYALALISLALLEAITVATAAFAAFPFSRPVDWTTMHQAWIDLAEASGVILVAWFALYVLYIPLGNRVMRWFDRREGRTS
jgi:hypothetical protein